MEKMAAKELMNPDQARSLVLESVAQAKPLAAETLSLANTAGRVAAQTLLAPAAMPAAPVSMMDGFAVRSAELGGSFAVAGEANAGAPWQGEVPPGNCVAVATGAWVPAPLDAVVPIEEAKPVDGKVSLPEKGPKSWIRPAGSEIEAGASVLVPGQTLSARRIALLASLGVARLRVSRRPRIGMITSGDELRSPGAVLNPGEIYDANRPLLRSLLRRHGCEASDFGAIPDDDNQIKQALADAAAGCDAVITCGGASVGERDLLRGAIKELGAVHMWKVAIKPGKPFMLGAIGNTPVYGLPGNPASVLVTFLMLVLPALQRLAGHAPLPLLPWGKAEAKQDFLSEPGRVDYQRGVLEGSGVVSAGAQHSAALLALADADCLLRIPMGSAGAKSGEMVDVLPLGGLD